MDNKQLGELVHKARNSGNEAFEILLSEFDRFIYWQANKLKNSFSNVCEFDDLVQIGRVSVWEAAMKCDADYSEGLRSYFTTFIKNDLLMNLKKSNAKKRKILNDSKRLEEIIYSNGSNDIYLSDTIVDKTIIPMEDYLEQKEQLQLIEDSKYNLSKREHIAFDLWVRDCSLNDIAIKTNTTYIGANKLVWRAKKKIRRNLEGMSS